MSVIRGIAGQICAHEAHVSTAWGGALMSNREGRAVVPMAIENMKNDPNINVGTRGMPIAMP